MTIRIAAGLTVAVVTALLPTQLAGAATTGPAAHHDETVRVTDDGHRFYVDPAPERPDTSDDGMPARGRAAALPTSQTFRLHSLPTSNRKIYLDFNGHNLPASSRWVVEKGVTPGPVSGFSLDGSAGFSAVEHAHIQEIWRITAEKYSPFNVDVTTQDPGSAALVRSSSKDQAFGVRALVTNDPGPAAQLCGGTCGGVAWLDVYDLPNQAFQADPAWIFAQNTFRSTTITANTVAHEVGHTLGLRHDGKSDLLNGTDYYAGHANWIPIMGLGTDNRAIAQFSKGEYAGATNAQDDFAVMAATGISRRADDGGNTPGTATPLAADTVYRRNGVISTAADIDIFRINRTCAAPLTATASTIGTGAALDVALEILDRNGTVIGANNPASGQTSVGGQMVPTGVNAAFAAGARAPGTYFVRLYGVGSGSSATTGYSDYGSVGQYALSVTGCPAKKPSAAKIGKASSGKKGGSKNATARWSAPSSTGGTPITGYRVIAYKLTSTGRVVKTRKSGLKSASARSYKWALPAGRYKFKVVAYNKIGAASKSRSSKVVTSR